MLFSFFILIFFHFNFFIILIEILIVFFKNLFSTLTSFILKILNNFLFLTSTRSNRQLYYFRFFFNLNQKISKSSYFCVDNIYLMIYNMINRNNYVANATSLFNFFAHANDTINIFNQYIHKSFVVIISFNNY